ncbi:MAG: hypothetical protein IIY69_05270, partial [Clostridia bacterium]|nr:hypothetical protein [Clostridia bacterium]
FFRIGIKVVKHSVDAESLKGFKEAFVCHDLSSVKLQHEYAILFCIFVLNISNAKIIVIRQEKLLSKN